MKRILFFSLLIISCLSFANAQMGQFHTGITFPKGNFGENDSHNDKAGYASMGFDVGMKSFVPLSSSNFSLAFSFDFFYNGLQAKYKKELKEEWEAFFVENGYDFKTYTASVYLNMPVMAGFNYAYPLNGKKLKIYGEATAGYNYSLLTSDIVKFSTSDYNKIAIEIKTSYDGAYSFCYAFEGGLLLKWFRVGVRYIDLGNCKYKWTYYADEEKVESEELPDKKQLDISNLQVIIGFNF
jgi:hypothetical protein